jgi:hypothetical protein
MLCRIAHNGQDDGGQEGQRHTQLRAGLCNVTNITGVTPDTGSALQHIIERCICAARHAECCQGVDGAQLCATVACCNTKKGKSFPVKLDANTFICRVCHSGAPETQSLGLLYWIYCPTCLRALLCILHVCLLSTNRRQQSGCLLTACCCRCFSVCNSVKRPLGTAQG